MKQRIFLIVAGVLTVILGVVFLVLPKGPRWSTTSPEALSEFEAAWDASQKLYSQEARKHLEKAVALDGDFVVAKLRLVEFERYQDPEKAKALFADVRNADLSRLQPLERFLVERAVMLDEGHFEEARKTLDLFYQEHPDDPFVLYVKGMDAWQKGDLDVAEKLNSRLLEIRPNWVIAYNQLGYIMMLRGRFDKAEEYFTSYRFIAPDQANPHDSLGELYVLLGRYDEAERSFRKALEVKPDFPASLGHMATLEGLRHRWNAASEWVRRGVESGVFRDDHGRHFECSLKFWRLILAQDYESILEASSGDCDPRQAPFSQASILVHEAACATGKWDLAEAIESRIDAQIRETKTPEGNYYQMRRPILEHMRGIRFFSLGRFDKAIDLLQTTDEDLSFLNMELGLFKLNNRLILSSVLKKAGHEDESIRILEGVRKINPALAEDWCEISAEKFEDLSDLRSE